MMMTSTVIMIKELFDNVTFQFKTSSAEDSQAIDLSFTRADFVKLTGDEAEALFKSAAY